MYLERLQLKDITKYRDSPIRGFISYLRLRAFERKVHKLVDQFIAIAEADVPSYLGKKAAVIVPYLDAKTVSWNYTESGQVFFAGGGGHYHNFLAIEWLLCELAPKLLKLNSNIKIVIAGTAPNQVPENWQIENAELLGFVSQEKNEHLFQTADLFVCPIKNDHGVKIKSIECVSYGTPLFATAATLKGLPYLSDIPVLDLNNPDEAATYICEALSKREVLDQLSQKMINAASEFAITEKDRWGKTILD
jgi:glycosyltransferase involved in cell wall biosynthesis